MNFKRCGLNIKESIKEYINQIRLVDTHEHIISEEEWLNKSLDFVWLFQPYVMNNLYSAGMPSYEMKLLTNDNIPVERKWELVEPYWNQIKYTSYPRWIELSVRDIYGIDYISKETYLELTNKLNEARKPRFYDYILKERSRIDHILQVREETTSFSNPLFPGILMADFLLRPTNSILVREIGERTGITISNFDDYLSAVDKILETENKNGIKAIKIAAAYLRPLNFEDTTLSDAEKAFNRAMVTLEGWWGSRRQVTFQDFKPFQDFIVHYIVQRASEMDLPVQFHTGIVSSGLPISEVNPTLLNNLFIKFPKTRFVLFHGGFPFLDETIVLAKNFPNVYVDMCWMHTLAPSATVRFLPELLENVPWNKIFGTGGDSVHVEGAYGYSVLCREHFASALSNMVESNLLNELGAKEAARRLLRENAIEFFRLEGT